MKTQKEQAGFKPDGKYAVWGTREAIPHALDGVLLVTNNRRDAIAYAKEAARQGWIVEAKENKYAGYPEAVLWTNATAEGASGQNQRRKQNESDCSLDERGCDSA
jgi:hypothetical protein